ncbi:MAG: thioredoxin-dependent thiol peroxidase [Phycisphaeraceae bacterium]|nr:thioredoxin-dependent thiol peroxidase [Phycisphaeraceae bacterium]
MTTPSENPLIDLGKKAPAFALKNQEGTLCRLSQYAGQWVILYFYPKDNTSSCTKQACAFRDQLPDFSSANAVVLGVSPDDEKSHTKFIQKHDLPFTLLADPEHQALTRYGVWQEKSMYGRKYMGVVRTTYLIDPKGKVAQRWDKVKVANHIQDVLESLTRLQQEG